MTESLLQGVSQPNFFLKGPMCYWMRDRQQTRPFSQPLKMAFYTSTYGLFLHMNLLSPKDILKMEMTNGGISGHLRVISKQVTDGVRYQRRRSGSK